MRNSLLKAFSAAALAMAVSVAAPNVSEAQSGTGNAPVNSPMSVSAEIWVPLDLTLIDLYFMDVLPGVDKTVDASDETANGFIGISGQPNQNLELTVTFLPSELLHDGDGSTILPLDLWQMRSGTDASCSDGMGATSISAGQAYTASLDASGTLNYCLGATVHPDNQQKSGTYAATPAAFVLKYLDL